MAEKQIFVVGRGIFTGLATVFIDVFTVAQGPGADDVKQWGKCKCYGRREKRLQLCLFRLKKNCTQSTATFTQSAAALKFNEVFHDPFWVSS